MIEFSTNDFEPFEMRQNTPLFVTSDCWTKVPLLENIFDFSLQPGTYIVQANIIFGPNIWFLGDEIKLTLNYGEEKVSPEVRRIQTANERGSRGTKQKYHERIFPQKRIITRETLSLIRQIEIKERETISCWVYQNSGISVTLETSRLFK